MGATWLGGVATFTTAKDPIQRWSIVLARPLLDVFTWYFGFLSMFSCDLCFHWDVGISCSDDVRFDAFPYYDD